MLASLAFRTVLRTGIFLLDYQSAFLGIGITALLAANNSLTLPLATLGFGALVLAFTTSPLSIDHKPVFWSLFAFCAISTIGAIGAGIWGGGYPSMSFVMAGFAWYGLLLYCTRPCRRVWEWIVAGLGIHAGLIFVQGVMHYGEHYRAEGFADGSTQAAGYLGVAAVYLATTRRWYLAVPFVMAIPLTGSRLPLIATMGVLAGLALWKLLRPRHLLILCVCLLLSIVAFWPATERSILPGSSEGSRIPGDIGGRFQAPSNGKTLAKEQLTWPGILPQGYAGGKDAHVSLVRLWYEIGAPGLLSLGMAWTLSFRRLPTTMKWLAVILLGLASLDFYVIMPPASLLWWLVISGRRGRPAPPLPLGRV